MSAQLAPALNLRRMTLRDLDAVMAIENDVYPHPWTRGNFTDSLASGYDCWAFAEADALIGYAVITSAADDAHLLNLSIAARWHRHGLGRQLLAFVVELVRGHGVRQIFLEVRPSNAAGRALYAAAGFEEIGIRRNYYPAHDGREDAVVMQRVLT